MPMSRREFLGRAALGSAALGLAVPSLAQLAPLGAVDEPRCSILDLGAGCILRESLDGYRARMPATLPRVPVLIVPAALSIPAREVERCLQSGGMVVYETGAAFAHPSRFGRHADMLMDALGIQIAPPVALWPRRTPYVDFTWPAAIKVRDFSRLVPLESRYGEAIATADGFIAGIRSTVGGGTLVVLGTPLGPALLAGDEQAERWLRSLWGAGLEPFPRSAVRVDSDIT